jgi:DNA-binding GntR family transcriptional regulator
MSTPAGANLVINDVRRDILAGEYHPRERLVEGHLAERYNAPRASVRAALLTLAAEGLVNRQPNRGASVRSFTVEEAIEVAETRGELEALCAKHAALLANAAECEQLRSCIERMRTAVENDSVDDYRRISVQFHELIGSMARHSTAQRFLAEMRNHNLALHFPLAFPERSTGSSLPEHEAVAEALFAHDGAAAERAMRDHVGTVARLLVEYRERTAAP